jgi:hypothetical protein
MQKALNSNKRPELAAYYGTMTGQDLIGSSRLNMLGWQVKRADVTRTREGLRVDLWIGGEGYEDEMISTTTPDSVQSTWVNR